MAGLLAHLVWGRCISGVWWMSPGVCSVCRWCVHPVSGVGAVCGVTVVGAWPSVGEVGAVCAESVARNGPPDSAFHAGEETRVPDTRCGGRHVTDPHILWW